MCELSRDTGHDAGAVLQTKTEVRELEVDGWTPLLVQGKPFVLRHKVGVDLFDDPDRLTSKMLLLRFRERMMHLFVQGELFQG